MLKQKISALFFTVKHTFLHLIVLLLFLLGEGGAEYIE